MGNLPELRDRPVQGEAQDRGDVVLRRAVFRPEIPGRGGLPGGPVRRPQPVHRLLLLRRVPDQRRGKALLDAPQPPRGGPLEVQAPRRRLHHPPPPGPHGFLHHPGGPADDKMQIHRSPGDLPEDEEQHGSAGGPDHRGQGREERPDRGHEDRPRAQLRRDRDQDRV